MTDPMPALISYQQAYKARSISPKLSKWGTGLLIMSDEENGQLRVTHALLEGDTVLGIVMYCIVDNHENLPCFQLGYAVAAQYRRKGVGTALLTASLNELISELQFVKLTEYYLEAVVGVDNVASNKIATKLLSENPARISDHLSGDPAFQYFKRISRFPDIGR